MAGGILGYFFGKKPKVPELPKVSPGEVQKQAVSENVAALPGAQNLAESVNQFNLDQLAKALQFSLPGGMGAAQQNILSQLKGELSPEDTRSTIRSATAAGFGRGIGGAGIGRNLVLRDIGRSVQEQKQTGFQNFLQLAQATRPPQFDVSSMFFTPQQRLSFAVQENEAQFARNLAREQIAAAPSPFGQWVSSTTQQMLVAAAGSVGKAIAD